MQQKPQGKSAGEGPPNTDTLGQGGSLATFFTQFNGAECNTQFFGQKGLVLATHSGLNALCKRFQ
jgi:hypothetical protein